MTKMVYKSNNTTPGSSDKDTPKFCKMCSKPIKNINKTTSPNQLNITNSEKGKYFSLRIFFIVVEFKILNLAPIQYVKIYRQMNCVNVIDISDVITKSNFKNDLK